MPGSQTSWVVLEGVAGFRQTQAWSGCISFPTDSCGDFLLPPSLSPLSRALCLALCLLIHR